MRIILLEIVGKCEGYDGQPSVVVSASVALVILLLALLELQVTFFSVNIANLRVC